MNMIFRLLWVWLRARLAVGHREPVPVLGPCETPFVVKLRDLDLMMHVNNGRYLSIMDVARVDLMLRSGTLGRMRARGWYPVVASQTIVYGRSLKLFERFVVRTRVIGWDARCIYLAQDFLKDGDGETSAVARAVVQARFLGPKGERVPTEALLSAIGVTDPPEPLPGWVTDWAEAKRTLRGTPI